MPSVAQMMPSQGLPDSIVTASDANDLAEMKVAAAESEWTELGTTGLKRAGGYIDDEFLPELKSRKAVQIYREMGDNDPIVGTMLFALTYLLREVKWTVKEAGRTKEDADAAKLLETSMDDMEDSWGSTVAEWLSCLQYGWSWAEPLYKRSIGPWETDPRRKSNHTDGMVRWRGIPIRSQESMQRWAFDDNNRVIGMVQQAPPDYRTRYLPLDRSLHFKVGPNRGNPEGYSFLRRAYRPWFFKKRFEEHEAIGVERDLAGLPKATVPSSYLKARPGTEQHKMVEGIKTMIRSVRRNEQEGVIFPAAFDDETKQALFTFELMSSGGARQFSPNEIIQRLEQRILMTCLADFILVGHEETGTYNMHADKRGIFNTALNTVIREVAAVVNHSAVPSLFLANGWKPQRLPTFVPADVDAPDLGQLATFLTATAGVGFPWGPNADIERYLREAANLPELTGQDYDRVQRMGRRTEATRMFETDTAYLAAKQALAQAKATGEQMATGEPTVDEATLAAGQMQAEQQGQGDQVAAQQQQEQHDATMATSQMNLLSQYQQMRQGGKPTSGAKK